MGNQTGNKIKTIMTVKLFGSALLLLLSLHIGNAAPANQRLSDAKLPPDEVNEAELDAYKDAALEFVKVFNDDLAKIAKEEEDEEKEEDEVTSPLIDDDDDDDDSDEDEDEDEPENEPSEPFGDEDNEKPAHLVLEVIDETRTTKSAIDDYEDEGDDEEVVEVIKVDPKKGSKHSDPHIIAIEDKNAGQDNDADNELLLAALAAEDKESEDDGEVIEVIKSDENDETEDYESEDDEVIEVIKAEDHETEASSSDDKEVIEVVKVDPKKGSKHSDSHIVETILEKPVPEAKLKPTEKTAKRPSKPKEEVIEVIKAKDPETEDSSSDDNKEVIEVIEAEDYETEDSSSDDDEEVIEVVKVEPKVESKHINNPNSVELSSEDDKEVIEVVKVEPKVGSKPIVDPRIADIVSELDAAGERAVNEIEWESQNILDSIRDEAEKEVEMLLHKDAPGSGPAPAKLSDAKRYA